MDFKSLIRLFFRLAPGLVLTAALLPLPAGAQLRASEDLEFGIRGGIGWAGSLPESLLGASAFFMFPGGRWGLYLDAKIPHDSLKRGSEYEDDLSVEQVEAEFPPERRIALLSLKEWRIFNVAFVRPFTRSSALVIGGGLAQLSSIQGYGDEGEDPINPTGYFYVQDDRESGWEPTGIAAAMFEVNDSFALLAGFDLAPRTFTFAAYYLFR